MPTPNPSNQTSNPLDGTLFPPIIKAVSEYWDQNMTTELKNNIVLWLNLFVIAFVIYTLWLLLSRFLQLRKPRHYLKVTFDQDLDDNEGYDSQMLGLISGLHTLAKSSVVTFELHKSTDFTGFLFSSSDESLLNHIKSELSRIGNLGIEVLTGEYEPLTYQFMQCKEKITSRPYQLQMVASQEYGNFRKDQLALTRSLVGTMQSTPKDQFGSVVFAFRPVIKEFKIKSKVAKLEYKIMKDSKEYAVNPGINKEIAQLEEKNQYNMFATRISVVGSTRQVVDSLSASFNLVSAQNSFRARLSSFKLAQFRFVPKENIFKIFNCNAFGSVLNIRELTSLLQLTQFQNLAKIRNNEKNLESREINVEAVPKVIKKSKSDKTTKPPTNQDLDSTSQNEEIEKPKTTEQATQKTTLKPVRVKVKKFPRLVKNDLETEKTKQESNN
jgi:hypothetical protein